MKKREKAKRTRKRSPVKDLSAKKASAVKGGLTGSDGGVSNKFSPTLNFKY